MEDLTKLTPTELLKMGNDIKAQHDKLKENILADTYEMEKLEISINEKAKQLEELEQNYVEIVEMITKWDSFKTTEEDGI
jgi:septal ring factor EnvC (AmiA/AmiB activator)